jgi:tripartite-type tricarboxylate transporter receptor subunit TctC
MQRRTVLAAALLALAAGAAHAQAWPAKPVKIVVAYPAGSTMDILARMLSVELQSEMGGTFLVDNKPGVSGRIGAEFAARSPPDGYTLFISGNSTHSANPSLYKQLQYDPVKDFTQIIRISTMPYAIVVGPKMAAKTLAEFTAQARANSGKMSYAYGSPSAQIAAVAFSSIEGFQAVGVPYKGQPPAITDLIGGQIDFLMADLPVLVPHVKAGSLRALTVFSDKRSALLPDVPTMGEVGVTNYNLAAWIGLSGPAGMPAPVVNSLSGALSRILVRPKVTAQLLQLGMEHSPNTPDQFNAFVKEQLSVWGRRVHDAGIKPE